MPSVTVAQLKKENDALKDEIAAFRQNLESLNQHLNRNDGPSSSDGSQCAQLDAATLGSLEFYGKSYDDLNKSRVELNANLNQLRSRLDLLAARVEEISTTLEQVQRYSYQYNIKIIGLPETDAHESASDTTALCLNLFKQTGVSIANYDIDIAHRIPTRNATSGPRPVICKFTRRSMKDQVLNVRKDACKVSATSIGLPAECSMQDVKLFDHLTPQLQQLLVDAKKFQTRNGFRFCWSKNFIVYLRKTEDSRPVLIKSHNDLERLAEREGLPLS